MATPPQEAPSSAAPPAPREKPLRRALRSIASAISSRLLKLCWVTYALGILWVLLHPAVTVTTGELKPRGTYISENALLVDSMDATVSHDEESRVREWHKSFASIPGLPPRGCGDTGDCTDAVEWLHTQLQSIDRVEAFQQRFTAGKDANGTNVYGILRAAPLADHKESIVLVAHYRNIGSDVTHASYSGVALGLTLLEFLSRAKWLAKDVILVFTDDGPQDGHDGFAPGTDAWLRGYHSDPLEHDGEQALPMRAGLIRAAINLETIGDLSQVDVVGVFTAGSNGQLPNLDLVNTAVSHTHLESVPVVLDRCLTVQQVRGPSHEYHKTTCSDTLESLMASVQSFVKKNLPGDDGRRVAEYVRNLHGMLRFMKTLATGPSGPHGRFISYNIDAITFSLTQSIEPQHWTGAKSIRSVLRALELVVRSMSNLEEKLHQSFYLYVLPNNHNFVSVGEYYYTVALAVSPAIMHLLVTASGTASMRVAFALAVAASIEALGLLLLMSVSQVASSSFLALVVMITVAQAIVVVAVVPWLHRLRVLRGNVDARAWRLSMEQFDAKAKATTATNDDASASLAGDSTGWRALKCALLALTVFSHCILGILNYPMALFCAVPMAIFSIVEPQAVLSGIKSVVVIVWLLASSPLGLFALLSLVDAAGTAAGLSYFVASFARRINLLALPYLCCIYLPVHTLAVAVYLSPADAASTKKHSNQTPTQHQ